MHRDGALVVILKGDEKESHQLNKNKQRPAGSQSMPANP